MILKLILFGVVVIISILASIFIGAILAGHGDAQAEWEEVQRKLRN